jgi:hypothetical protein
MRIKKRFLHLIFEDYKSGMSLRNIGEKYRVSHEAVRKLIIKHNIKKPNKKQNIDESNYTQEYTLDKNFFTTIDSSNKAYFLGAIYNNGIISRNKARLTVHTDNEHILLTLKKEIKTNRPIYYSKTRNSCCLDMKHNILIKSLVKHGCSFSGTTSTFPNTIPKNLIVDFIRGYFDKYGQIYFDNKKSLIIIQGDKFFLIILQKTIYDNIKIRSSIEEKKESYNLIIGTNYRTKVFCYWLYKNAILFFKNKYINYLKIMKLP